ncbi:MAG: class I SAM-dependent methyltransferase [Cyanobacteria bacterium P01_F01_bin.143]
MQLLGHVDVKNSQLISGWAFNKESKESIYVDIIVNDVLQARVAANLPRPDLARVNVTDGSTLHGFQYNWPWRVRTMPTEQTEIKVCFANTKKTLPNGLFKFASLIENYSKQIESEFRDDSFWRPSISIQNRKIHLGGYVLAKDLELKSTDFVIQGRPFEQVKFIENEQIQKQFWFLSSRKALFQAQTSLIDSDFENKEIIIDWVNKKTNQPCNLNQRIYIPKEVFNIDKINLPTQQLAARVSGPKINMTQFVIGGYSTYQTMLQIINECTEKKLSDFKKVLDWGCGCGRVSRYFLNNPDAELELYGTDIDSVNIDWCRQNFSTGNFSVAPLYPPLQFEDNQFDLCFGISVFTHLTEYTQHQWLQEIRRIMKPGGIVFMTYHGEFVFLSSNVSTRIMENTLDEGFNSEIPDTNLGTKLPDKDYYKATYHSTDYVRRVWGNYFDILDIRQATNGYYQNIVVMRAI